MTKTLEAFATLSLRSAAVFALWVHFCGEADTGGTKEPRARVAWERYGTHTHTHKRGKQLRQAP